MYESLYFSEKETGCRCGKCGQVQGMPESALIRADMLRDLCGFALNMSSGYRCPLHPENATGPHSEGAFDIEIGYMRAHTVLKCAMILGFKGIGIQQKGNKRFIHLDDCEAANQRPRPHVWSY